MSIEDLKEYGRRAAEDPELRAKAKEIGLENIEGQIAQAKTLGLEFTAADMEALGNEVAGELSEDQLELVAGGAVTTTVAAVAAGAAVVGAAAAVVGAAAAVTSTTQGKGW